VLDPERVVVEIRVWPLADGVAHLRPVVSAESAVKT
jgi:hypothetical protein